MGFFVRAHDICIYTYAFLPVNLQTVKGTKIVSSVLGAINCPGAGCPYPEALAPLTFTASGGNDMIFYQSSNLYTLQNVANPITVTISYTSGGNFPASICLNPDMINSPIS